MKKLLLNVAVSISVVGLYGYVLVEFTDASYPFIDSVVLVFSVLAQLLLVERKIENWICWILVDGVATPLYASKSLYITAIIYFVFLINAVYGLINWIKIYRLECQSIETA